MALMRKAALYLRSSRDRHDISIEAQRHELKALAKLRGWQILAEFADVVESGKDDDRAGFQALTAAIKDRSREWDAILLLDTSRLARNRYIAVCFEHDCKRHGVEVVYKSIPDSDPLTTMLLKAIMQAWDEYHSLVSRQKGLAGMAANVRAGFRAGGRAPHGYRLVQHQTGAIREGQPVVKSTLEPVEPTASHVREFLVMRAAGVSRAYAAEQCGLGDKKATSLIGIEWNALTYAGHTVWNVQAARTHKGGAYVGGMKRRPRKDWMIQRDTHAALITDAQAEAIVGRLETAATTRPRNRRDGPGLLVGLLRAPDGKAWWSDGPGVYRLGKGKRVSQPALDAAVVEKVMGDLQTDTFARSLMKAAQAKAVKVAKNDDGGKLAKRLREIEARIAKMMDLAAELADAAPALRQIDTLEAERRQIAQAVALHESAQATAGAVSGLTEGYVRRMLADMATALQPDDHARMREALALMVAEIRLDPASLHCEIHYRIKGNNVASPRGCLPTPPLELSIWSTLAWRMAA